MTFQIGALGGVSKFMQIVHLECVIWDEIREVLVIILFPHKTFYQLQVNQGPQFQLLQLSGTTSIQFLYLSMTTEPIIFCQKLICPLKILLETNLGVHSFFFFYSF